MDLKSPVVFLVLVLLIIVAILIYRDLSSEQPRLPRIFGGEIVGGRAGTEYVAILMVKVPLEVREMQRKYIPHVTIPAHLTLAYLRPTVAVSPDAWIKKLSKLPPIDITFNHMKVVDTFVGLLPTKGDVKKLKGISNIFKKWIKHGPRGGYHMSVAYYPDNKPVSKYVLKDIRENMPDRPFTVEATSIKVLKRTNYGEWVPYKTVNLKS